MNKYTIISLSVAGGVLSGLAWMDWCSGLVLLIAFAPFFLIENHLFENRKRYSSNAFFVYLIPGFVIFSILTLSWIRVASILAAICVILGVSFLMAFIMWFAHIIRLKAGNIPGSIFLITFWLTFEFLCLNITLLSPWINLGNGLSKDILFIQWYEVTGTAGGTLWILTSNLFFTIILTSLLKREIRRSFIKIILWLILIIVPSVISITRYVTIKTSEEKESEILIIQPNIDPYREKFTIPFTKQLKQVIEIANQAVTKKTDWIITPETTVDDPVNESDLSNNQYVLMIKELATRNPGACVITGMVSYRYNHMMNFPPANTAMETDKNGFYYDYFNSAFKIDTGKSIDIYHKSKLVPGFEMQFSNGLGRLIKKILPDLGGTNWGYGVQKERDCFEHSGIKHIIAPIICYESVFGKYVTDYVKKGAEALFIITNDGWWKNTNGYKQHLSYASLRAIETRRSVLRAANTGISCIIDIRGKVIQKTEWWIPETLKGNIKFENRMTPYVKYGDYLLNIACFISFIIALYVLVILPLLRKNEKKI